MVRVAVALWIAGYGLLAIMDWLPPRVGDAVQDGMNVMCLAGVVGGILWLIGRLRERQ